LTATTWWSTSLNARRTIPIVDEQEQAGVGRERCVGHLDLDG
jgi:hypothetical protein